jgi:hypothetical protein
MKASPWLSRRALARVVVLGGVPVISALILALLPLPLNAANITASVVLVVSLFIAFLLPRRLARRAGRTTALSFTMIVLGCIGLLIGMLSGTCAAWTPVCRREIGGWLVTWMALAPAAQGVLLTARGMRALVMWPRRLLRRR